MIIINLLIIIIKEGVLQMNGDDCGVFTCKVIIILNQWILLTV